MDEMTISITDLLAVVARKGKRVIIIALAFAVLLGAYKGFSIWRNMNDEEYVNMEQIEYEQELLKLERSIETAQKNIDQEQDYIGNSLWMSINPYDKYVAEVYVSITGIDEKAVDMTFGSETTPVEFLMNKITTQYQILWSALDLPSALGLSQYEAVMDKYVREIVSASFLGEGIICFTAIGNSAAEAEELAQAACSALLAKRDTVVDNSYEHDIASFDFIEQNQIDADMAAAQIAHYEAIDAYNDTIIESENTIKTLSGPDSVPVAIIKMVIIGGLVGGVLACAWYVVMSLLKNTMQSSGHVENALKIPYIASLSPKKGLFEKLGRSFSGEHKWESDEQALGYVAETIRMRADGKKLLIASTLSEEKFAEQLGKLKRTVSAAMTACDFTRDPNAVAQLGACDAVLLVESIDRTKLSDAKKVLDLAAEREKPVVGFVVV